MYFYRVIHYFVGGGVKVKIFTWDLKPDKRGENYFRKMAVSLYYFYMEIGSSISKIGNTLQ